MLNNDKSFKRLMALLCSIDPKVPLPLELETYLLLWMIAEPYCKRNRVLQEQGMPADKAFYVVHGKVLVYAWCPNGYRYLYRIYRENTIVATDCFMNGDISEYEIVGCKDSLIWSVSAEHMNVVYDSMPGMREMALKTAFMYSESKGKLRADLLAMVKEERILRFYRLFKGLLPARYSPIRDGEIADFLAMPLEHLKRTKMRLRRQKRLPWAC